MIPTRRSGPIILRIEYDGAIEGENIPRGFRPGGTQVQFPTECSYVKKLFKADEGHIGLSNQNRLKCLND